MQVDSLVLTTEDDRTKYLVIFCSSQLHNFWALFSTCTECVARFPRL